MSNSDVIAKQRDLEIDHVRIQKCTTDHEFHNNIFLEYLSGPDTKQLQFVRDDPDGA